jgi:hypothetical protein
MIGFLLYFREIEFIFLFGKGEGAEKEYIYGNIEYEKPFHSLSSFNGRGYIENPLPSPGGRGLRGGGNKILLITLTPTLSRQGRGVILDFPGSRVMNPS